MRAVNPGIEVQGQYSGGTAVELFTVGRMDRVWLLADVYEADVPRIKPGVDASVQVIAYKDKLFQARVDWVQHMLDPQTRTAKARISFDNPDGSLFPEMFGTVLVHVAPRRAAAIPRGALVRLGDQHVVFVETGKSPDGVLRFERRPSKWTRTGPPSGFLSSMGSRLACALLPRELDSLPRCELAGCSGSAATRCARGEHGADPRG